MRYTFLIPALIVLGTMMTQVHAADVIVDGVNLGACKTYSDGCNTCSVGADGKTACTLMACETKGTPKCLDTPSDTQIIDLEQDKQETASQTLTSNFKLQSFNSCENMEGVMKNFIKDYYEAHPYNPGYFGRGGGMADDQVMMESDAVAPTSPVANQGSDGAKGAVDVSKTNLQVLGVDEPEIIKTDGTHIYFYNSKDHSIYIAKAFPTTELSLVKKIKLPTNFSNPQLFLSGKKLSIISTKYSTTDYGSRYWFNRQVKTAIVVYDLSNMASLKIDRYYEVDGNVTQSRMIGKHLYVLSSSNFAFPYPLYYGGISTSPVLDEAKFDAEFNGSKIKPRKVELRKTNIESEQNFSVKGRALPYNLTQKDTSTCADIEYVLPDKETMKKFNFNPNLVTLSIINTEDTTQETKTKVLFGDVSEIHMSLTNLYIASHLSTSYDFKCAPGMFCIMPNYYQGQNTLIHKLAIKDATSTYVGTTIVPGSPLNQYSMDEDATGNFRIVTSHQYPERSTEVFILDPKLALLGKLSNIAKDETFQSSRFIGNRLYLVTFEQIDPLFVIDLANPRSPKILGELKIPGYSTYLHPYDATHLIGVGYDTKVNTWGGTQNAGIKVDLYNVADVANPKQISTLTLGDQGSTADVLFNPRLFVWSAARNLLFMPATLMTSAGDTRDTYRSKDAWQGTIALSIDPTNGVKEKARITHIETSGLEEKRTEECKQYAKVESKPVCYPIIGGGQYCTNPTVGYVPPYCYADSPIGEYFASQIWNYSNDFVVRNLYLDNALVTVSNNKMQVNDLNKNYEKIGTIELK